MADDFSVVDNCPKPKFHAHKNNITGQDQTHKQQYYYLIILDKNKWSNTI